MDELGLATNTWGSERRQSGREVELVRQMNASLHELSQPLTVLLCALQAGADLDSVEELRLVIDGALEECRRLQETVQVMQMQVQQNAHGDSSTVRVWT